MGGSIPSGPTINRLIAKKCKCGQAMHIHRIDNQVVCAACEPVIVDVRIEMVDKDNVVIKAKRSNKSVRCGTCRRRHLVRSFEEVKDGTG